LEQINGTSPSKIVPTCGFSKINHSFYAFIYELRRGFAAQVHGLLGKI
jgi:hypothetical protein